MPLTGVDKRAGWAAVILLLAIVVLIAVTMVRLVGPPNWRDSLVAIATVVLLLAFGPALGRWAGASVRRTLLVALAAFVATFCVEAVRSGLPVWNRRGFAGLIAMSLAQTFGVLVTLAVVSLCRVPAHRGPATAGGNRDGSGRATEQPR